MMNPEAQAEFNRITMLEPKEMSKDEVGFLRARRAYLRPEQKTAFASILKDTKEMSDDEKKQFEKANQAAMQKAKEEADKKAKQNKTVKESQNPEGN